MALASLIPVGTAYADEQDVPDADRRADVLNQAAAAGLTYSEDVQGNYLITDPSDPTQSVLLVSEEATGVTNGERYYAVGEIDGETLVILPEVSNEQAEAIIAVRLTGASAEELTGVSAEAAEQRTEVSAEAAEVCGVTQWTVPGWQTNWGNPYSGQCANFGYEGYQRTYQWDVAPASNGGARAQVRGFSRKVGGTIYVEAWYGAGCSTSGPSVYRTVPWGNMAAVPQWRGYSSSIPVGAYGTFK